MEPLIQVQGAPSYRHNGSILFTTVSLAGDVTTYGWLHGRLSPNDDIVSRHDITGGTPTKTYNQENIQAMTDSKTAATKVALERLGYPVTTTADGVEVVQVTAQGPAEGKLRAGDVITAIDGTPVTLDDQLVSAVHRHKPGDPVTFTFSRGGQSQTTQVQAADDGHGTAKIGVVLQTRNLQFHFPVTVTIDTGKVSGPSAGLAFTLALLDDLDAAGLTGGKKVAVTGTIDIHGRVGPVGGVAQKTAAARQAGAVAFLVPPEEQRDAQRHAGTMRIIPVRTLDDALAALQQLGGSGLPPPTTPRPTTH